MVRFLLAVEFFALVWSPALVGFLLMRKELHQYSQHHGTPFIRPLVLAMTASFCAFALTLIGVIASSEHWPNQDSILMALFVSVLVPTVGIYWRYARACEPDQFRPPRSKRPVVQKVSHR